jgi:hypothetical protein
MRWDPSNRTTAGTTYPPATRCGHDFANGDALAVGAGMTAPSSRDCGNGSCLDAIERPWRCSFEDAILRTLVGLDHPDPARFDYS